MVILKCFWQKLRSIPVWGWLSCREACSWVGCACRQGEGFLSDVVLCANRCGVARLGASSKVPGFKAFKILAGEGIYCIKYLITDMQDLALTVLKECTVIIFYG